MNCFCAKKKMTSTGNVARTDALMSELQSVPASSVNKESASGNVINSLELINIKGSKNSFQFVKKVKMVTVANAGFESGSIICKKIRKREQPSIRAASSNSAGTCLKKLAHHKDAKCSTSTKDWNDD